MLRAVPICFTKADNFVKLWVHELTRIFADRLINNEDKEWFYNGVVTILSNEISR